MIGNTRLTGPDGEDLIILFDHAARLAAEDAADAPLGKVVEGAFNGRLGYMGCLLYGGLRRHHPSLRLADAHRIVEQAIAGEALLGLSEAIMKALEASMPKKVAGENPPPAPSGTGTPSSAPGAKKGSTRTRSGGKRPAASPQR